MTPGQTLLGSWREQIREAGRQNWAGEGGGGPAKRCGGKLTRHQNLKVLEPNDFTWPSSTSLFLRLWSPRIAQSPSVRYTIQFSAEVGSFGFYLGACAFSWHEGTSLQKNIMRKSCLGVLSRPRTEGNLQARKTPDCEGENDVQGVRTE